MTTAEIPAMPSLLDGGADLLNWTHQMRAERPLWQADNGVYHVFGYADVQTILSDPARFSSNLGRVMPFLDPQKMSGNLLWTDPPRHRTLRALAGHAFTSATVTGLRPRIVEITKALLAETPDEFDIVDRLAYPLPAIVIAEILGVSPADRGFFRESSNRMLGIRVEDGQSPEELGRIVAEAARDLDTYLVSHIRRLRANPSDGLLGRLTVAEVDGGRLTDLELVSFATLLLNAGYITTTLLLGNILLCLRDNPEVAARLRGDRSLIPAAIQEVLRIRPPFPHIYRITNQDVPIAGGTIPADAMVTTSVLSANHDERQFPDPERFRIDRDANRHLAFGHGIHFCLGAPLARLEAEIATNLLFDEFSDLTISDKPIFHETEFYGAKHMPVTVRR